jgi:antitoxin component of RelBE/YafQ-DinJ toxin-antitoxin module
MKPKRLRTVRMDERLDERVQRTANAHGVSYTAALHLLLTRVPLEAKEQTAGEVPDAQKVV